MKKLLTLTALFFALTFGANAQAEADAEYVNAIKRMMETSGQYETFNVVIDQMIEMYKTQFTKEFEGITDDQWDVLGNLIKEKAPKDLAALYAPIYAKYLSKKDIENLIGFYSSESGKKLSKFTPMITQEAMLVGEKWGQSLGADIVKALEEME